MMWGVGEDDTKGKHDPHTTIILNPPAPVGAQKGVSFRRH